MMIPKPLNIFIPATVSNVACGFDIMGFPMEEPGDVMTFRPVEEKKVIISSVTGHDDIPQDPEKNIAGIVATNILRETGFPFGVEMSIHKGISPGSGIGSSGASAAGAAFGVNHLAGNKWDRKTLVRFAMEGESHASGTPHADNVVPALYGGFVLVRSYNPLDIIPITPPPELWCSVIHPLIEVKTEYSRGIMQKNVSLRDAVTQWGNVAGLTAGLLTHDYGLIGRSLVDVIAEPVRAVLIPEFDHLKEAALSTGALGCSISGSGPSVFALSKGKATAEKVAAAFRTVYSPLDIEFETHVSAITPTGIHILENGNHS